MRTVATLGAVMIAAFLLGGCPAQDQNRGTDPAAAGAPSAPGDDSVALAAPVPEDSPASQPQSADDAAGSNTSMDDAIAGDTTAGDTTADDATEEGADEQPPVPDVVQIPQGVYVGSATVTEVAHCSGLYAAVAGAEVHNVTEWPHYGIRIYADGLPALDDQTVDVGGSIVEYTSSEVQTTADSVIVTWVAQINFIDPITQATIFSMPGTQTNVYRLNDDGSLQIDYLLSANVADDFGTIDYEATVTGVLEM
jgi:hypothetical protein